MGFSQDSFQSKINQILFIQKNYTCRPGSGAKLKNTSLEKSQKLGIHYINNFVILTVITYVR